MAPSFESLPKKLENLQEDRKAADSQPAAKKMPSKIKPAAVAAIRTVPPPPPPPVLGGRDARSGDDPDRGAHDREDREDPGDVALLGRVNLTPRRRPAKRRRLGKSSPQSFSPSMAWSKFGLHEKLEWKARGSSSLDNVPWGDARGSGDPCPESEPVAAVDGIAPDEGVKHSTSRRMNRHVGVNAPWRRNTRCPPPPPLAVGWPAHSSDQRALSTFDVAPPPPPVVARERKRIDTPPPAPRRRALPAPMAPLRVDLPTGASVLIPQPPKMWWHCMCAIFVMLLAQVLSLPVLCPCPLLGACPCPCLRDQMLTMSVACPCALPCACLYPMSFCPWRCVFRLSS
eukprot:1876880-Amphidinium_carterae.1